MDPVFALTLPLVFAFEGCGVLRKLAIVMGRDGPKTFGCLGLTADTVMLGSSGLFLGKDVKNPFKDDCTCFFSIIGFLLALCFPLPSKSATIEGSGCDVSCSSMSSSSSLGKNRGLLALVRIGRGGELPNGLSSR